MPFGQGFGNDPQVLGDRLCVTDLDILVLLTILWGGLSMFRNPSDAELQCRYCETMLDAGTSAFCSSRCEIEFTDSNFV